VNKTDISRPILTPKSVIIIFFIVGIIFMPIGGLLIWANSLVSDIAIDYSNCAAMAPTDAYGPIPASRVHKTFKNSSLSTTEWMRETGTTVMYAPSNTQITNVTKCFLRFSIDSDMHAPVLAYYRLTGFYQNHRRYVKSFDQDQLQGKARSAKDIGNSDCDPLRNDNATGKPIYPCGLIANSMFNDSYINLQQLNPPGGTPASDGNGVAYPMTTSGIAWPSDKDLYGKTKYALGEVVPPPNWVRRWPNYEKAIPDLETDQSFQVWMRTAALPTFSKLALRNDADTMTAGLYQIEIWDGKFSLCLTII
jgi:LEM3 (ligand-effect modulator 3) family / CDC50 family